MSPQRPPQFLRRQCTTVLCKVIAQTLSNEEGRYIKDVKDYLSFATSDALQMILDEILGNINLDAFTRVNCLEVLLRQDLLKLETGILPRYYWEKIIEILTVKGKNIQFLNLKGVWIRDNPLLTCKLIEELKLLKTLIIPHIADDQLLQSVANLKCIAKLDISGEAYYTQQGIRLLKSDTLTDLNIGSYGKPSLHEEDHDSFALVAEIVKNLPNLLVLRTYSFTGHALLQLYTEIPNFTTKLRYIHDTRTNTTILEAIIATCPYLENAHINCPEDGVVSRLSEITKMHSLKLTKGKAEEFKKLYQTSGDYYECLILNHQNAVSVDLSDLGFFAPNVKKLEFFYMKLKYINPNIYFMNLEYLKMQYCDITNMVVPIILMNCPQLKSLEVGGEILLNDYDFISILEECYLNNLEELIFYNVPNLSILSIETLICLCPKLRRLGSIVGWAVTPEDLNLLIARFIQNNIDIDLRTYT